MLKNINELIKKTKEEIKTYEDGNKKAIKRNNTTINAYYAGIINVLNQKLIDLNYLKDILENQK